MPDDTVIHEEEHAMTTDMSVEPSRLQEGALEHYWIFSVLMELLKFFFINDSWLDLLGTGRRLEHDTICRRTA